MSGLRIVSAAIMALILVTGSVGCGHSKPARFYLLTPMKNTEDRPKPVPRPNLVVGVGPIRFPEYLDRPQMVRRLDDNRVELAEYDRWAEPLADNFQRVLCENLAAHLGTQNIETAPFRPDVKIDLRVQIDVLRFDVTTDGQAVLVARHFITEQGTTSDRGWGRTEGKVLFNVESPGAAAEALSKALASFSESLATMLSLQIDPLQRNS